MYLTRERIDIKPDCPQLFVDDYLIDTISGVTPVLHQPEKKSPKEAKQLQKKTIKPSRTITPQERAHYSFPATQLADDPPVFQFSPDDIPDLHDMRSPTKKPIHIKFIWEANPGGYGLHRAVSPDGKDWGPLQLVWPRLNDGPGECHSIFWDYKKQCLVDTVRMGSNYPHGRTIGRGESYDFGLHWTPPVRILTEDEHDPEDYQVYHAESGIYAGIYLSIIHIYATESGLCFPMLATSRDGFHYDRYFREQFIPLGPEGGPDSGMLFARYPEFDGTKLRFLYSATKENHNMNPPYHHTEGVAYLRKDGFVSLDARQHQGTIVTKPFRCPTRDTFPVEGTLSIFVNAHVKRNGFLKISVLDQHGEPVNSRYKLTLDAKHADVITGNRIKSLVSWRGVSDVAMLNIYSRAIRLRFDMKNTSLYSFGFYEYHGTFSKPIKRVADLEVQEE